MTVWEKKIIEAFAERYLASSKKASAADDGGQRALRLRSVSLFPDFDAAPADEKESYLEAAEALERKGLLRLNWEKGGKGERLKTLACEDSEKLLRESGKGNLKAEAEKIRTLFRKKIPHLEALAAGTNNETGKYDPASEAAKIFSFLNYLAEDFSHTDLKRGIDSAVPEDLVCLMELALESAKWKQMSTRALSIQVYNDSKRLEYLLEFTSPFLSRAQKEGRPVPDFSFLERSFPETMIAGKLIFEFAANGQEDRRPLVNAGGIILGLPLPSVLEIKNIRTIGTKETPAVLTVENKETFYALAASCGSGDYDCCLYTSGYPNRAVSAILRLLASSGFSFSHAGDLDPDGILILQNIQDIAGKPVVPLRMDAATFDRYLPWSRPVNKNLSQLTLIREDMRAVPDLAGLIRRIEETSRGVEQEIIDYRETSTLNLLRSPR